MLILKCKLQAPIPQFFSGSSGLYEFEESYFSPYQNGCSSVHFIGLTSVISTRNIIISCWNSMPTVNPETKEINDGFKWAMKIVKRNERTKNSLGLSQFLLNSNKSLCLSLRDVNTTCVDFTEYLRIGPLLYAFAILFFKMKNSRFLNENLLLFSLSSYTVMFSLFT